MPKDSPGYDRNVKDRGLHANDGTDPTLASYLSSLVYALSVPVFLIVSYAGYWQGYYGQTAVVFVFGGLLVATIAVTFAVMHVATR